MSKDIWHKADEYNYSSIAFPEDAIVVDTGGGEYRAYSSFYDMPHHCDDPDCCFAETSCWKRWAKLDDLIALENELDRTRKALDYAIDVIQTVAKMSDKLSREYGETLVEQLDNIQAYCWQEGYVLTHEEDLERAITALEQKEG
jgi:hypothetical protein